MQKTYLSSVHCQHTKLNGKTGKEIFDIVDNCYKQYSQFLKEKQEASYILACNSYIYMNNNINQYSISDVSMLARELVACIKEYKKNNYTGVINTIYFNNIIKRIKTVVIC